MKMQTYIGILLLMGLLGATNLHARSLAELKVLYIGDRTDDFVQFIKPKVAQIETLKRAGFKPTEADRFDVVLLDWPQGEETREMRKLTSPLGKREEWHKPTVLLGSAGLNLAVAWKMKGGSGCTCMDPLAFGLREHEIFEQPFRIDRTKQIHIQTPSDFQGEIKESQITVLPLVTDTTRHWRAGWCTYSTDFASSPDVEYFCGGVNHKTPTAAGLWRQGNLLHFGFEQSPSEMNEQGRSLLLNSIAYISRFNEDRPIAITPSVFAGPVARPRGTPARWLRNAEYKQDWVKEMIAPELWQKLSADRDQKAAWFDSNKQFLHPNALLQLETDEDLKALGISFDDAKFFERALTELVKDGEASARARRLLERYVPSGPRNGDASEWGAWWKENRDYLFSSDSGDYCWYVDPLAKKRNVPSIELRGAKRADRSL